MSRGKKLARQMNERAASEEGQKRAQAMKQCGECDAWYSERSAGAKALHEEGRCS